MNLVFKNCTSLELVTQCNCVSTKTDKIEEKGKWPFCVYMKEVGNNLILCIIC